ncbi:MAG: hypothetical protein FWF42_02165 [Streptococcaceae bacterium]|nr:hypothetical protein [Streptococcaceae bacterium]MCL2681746.1 hypothetical protein [Streptococcaceae bacterium]MCL2858475.1 hypothetical protein [Streptococcaceae bacterium]
MILNNYDDDQPEYKLSQEQVDKLEQATKSLVKWSLVLGVVAIVLIIIAKFFVAIEYQIYIIIAGVVVSIIPLGMIIKVYSGLRGGTELIEKEDKHGK